MRETSLFVTFFFPVFFHSKYMHQLNVLMQMFATEVPDTASSLLTSLFLALLC